MVTPLFLRLMAIVLARGLTPGKVGRYLGHSTYDGGAQWDTATQGPVPTTADIQAVTSQQLAAAQTFVNQKQRGGDLDNLPMRAVARAVHVRLGRPDFATMSSATWRSILEAAWDAERG